MGRRALIADAGMRIIARDGVRALTHRAVDREAGLSQGSSSYYVPTRSALIELIVRALVERSSADAEQAAHAASLVHGGSNAISVPELATAIAGLIETFASRAVEMRTRYALLLELDHGDPARIALSQESPVQRQMLGFVVDVLEGLGVRDAPERAIDLFALTEGLLAHQVITGRDASSVAEVVGAYLRGLTATN